jgi:hypothetical protein
LYASPGASGTDINLYAIDSQTGQIYDIGVEAPSDGSVYGVIVITP